MKNIGPLVIAFVLGFFAVFGVQRYISKKDQEYKNKVMPKMVVVASQKISAGQKLTVENLREREFPAAMLPENVITKDNIKDVLKKAVNRDVYPGEPILWSFMGAVRKEMTLSQVVKPDERAITISVEKTSGVDGYIQPNDRVDIYILTDIPTKKKQEVPGKDGEMVSIEVGDKKPAGFVLLQNVLVLATGDSFGRGIAEIQQDYSSVTLAVTPKEAGLIKFASEAGRLSLTLRNPQDFGEVDQIEICDMDSILDVAKLRQLQDDRKKRIEVYRQGKAEIVER